MNATSPNQVRNVAFVGSSGAGKTTLTEALLYAAGAVQRPGSVEKGTTTTDFDPEETQRHISISLALAPFEYRGFKINVIDCPGTGDFLTEVDQAFQVADAAIIVVSAVDGIEAATETAWRLATERGLPRMIFVNKLDREHASFETTVEQLRAKFGEGIAPLELPIGNESSFRAVADLLTEKSIAYEDGRQVQEELPAEIAEEEHKAHDSLVEELVVADDRLTERYLEGDVPSSQELEDTLAVAMRNGSVVPVLEGSALTGIGVAHLADYICEICPSPADRPPMASVVDTNQSIACDPGGQPLAYVFKTISDPYVGKVSLAKVLSGTLKPGATLTNQRTHESEHISSLAFPHGKRQESTDTVTAGDIVALPKLSSTLTGDTLGAKTPAVTMMPPPVRANVSSVAIRPKSQQDDDKMMSALRRLQEEDCALRVERSNETHQTVISGGGDTHLEVIRHRLESRFGVHVDSEDLLVPYRETITQKTEAEGRYKKQSGGHGQFGVVNLRLEPLPRGSGFEFVDEIVGGAIPRQFIPAVEKGIVEAMESGGRLGYRVVDIRAVCLDGKFHPVDSSEMSFKMAGSLAFKEAFATSQPIVLEPVSTLEVITPAEAQGDVLRDISSRRGHIQGSLPGPNDEVAIAALVPTAEINRYASDLRSITGGRGRFTVSHDHYDEVPPGVLSKLQ